MIREVPIIQGSEVCGDLHCPWDTGVVPPVDRGPTTSLGVTSVPTTTPGFMIGRHSTEGPPVPMSVPVP